MKLFHILASIVVMWMICSLGWAQESSSPASTSLQSDEDVDATPKRVGWLKLTGVLRDGPPAFPWLPTEQRASFLADVMAQLRTVAEDDTYAGVVIHLDGIVMALSQIDEISDAIHTVRNRNKLVLAFSASYNLPQYLLACSAELVLLQHKGNVQLSGLAIEEMYLAGLLEKLGLQVDVMQVGRFKGPGERFSRRGPSAAWNQNIDSVLDDLYEHMLQRIGERRGMTKSKFEEAMAKSWSIRNRDEYIELGLIDRLVDRSLVDVTKEKFGRRFEWDRHMGRSRAPQAVSNPLTFFQMLLKTSKPTVHTPSLAVVHMSGPIHRGKSSSPNPMGISLFTADSIGSKTIVKTLGEVKQDDMIKGVVLRIDSPGGSALASDMIWQVARQLNEKKPVYVSIGSMAASGGYYIASAGGQVYANPRSLIGSIGVVGGKIAMGGLYEKFGIQTYHRARGPLADMFSSAEPFDAQQRSALFASMELIYDDFTERVVAGRGERVSDIDAVAHGRLFTGRQGLTNGLIDKLGGVETALRDLAKEVGLVEGEYEIIDLPPPKNLADVMSDILGVRTLETRETLLLQAARDVIGSQSWRNVKATLGGMMLLQREPVLTLLPVAINVR